jgi:hypothetical protein
LREELPSHGKALHFEAERVVVFMGSVGTTTEDVVDYLHKHEKKTSILEARLCRPFSTGTWPTGPSREDHCFAEYYKYYDSICDGTPEPQLDAARGVPRREAVALGSAHE